MITNIHDEDWDLLIVLDACRLDSFQEKNTIPGELDVLQTGSSTDAWVDLFFSDYDNCSDVVYLAGTPVLNHTHAKRFACLRAVWNWGWDFVLHTVHPTLMCSEIISAHRRFPDNRIVTHFLQPHHPFIGEYRIPNLGYDAPACAPMYEGTSNHVWMKLSRGEVAVEDVKRAYLSNLEFVLKYVEAILTQHDTPLFDRNIVICSDHGNLFGEHGYIAHPPNKTFPELVYVPWFRVELDGDATPVGCAELNASFTIPKQIKE